MTPSNPEQLERVLELGNRLAVVAEDCHDKLLEATGSADGWKVIEDWWKLREALSSPPQERECPECEGQGEVWATP